MAENNYTVLFTRAAMRDLDEIYRYIYEELLDDHVAIEILNRIENSIMLLRKFPKMGSKVRDEYIRMKGYRKIVVDPYITFYIVNDEKEKVIIMRVLYGKRKYEDLL